MSPADTSLFARGLRVAAIGLFAAAAISGCECGAESVVQALKPLGEPCAADHECESNLCDSVLGAAKVCIKPCSWPCDASAGEICDTIGLLDGAARQACVPDKGGLCDPCLGDGDCPYPGDKCLPLGGQSICGRDCSYDGACPNGWVCADAKNVAGELVATKQCQPVTGTCECTPKSAGQTRSCTVTNAFGSCGGMETCDPTKGFVGCSAKVPQAEKCNLEDDNCDGQVDEPSEKSANPAAGIQPKTCGKGACFRSIPGCFDGKEQTCEPGLPQAEICNGLDDDCNGTVDDAWAADLGKACTNGSGVCQMAGKVVCMADGSGTACNAVPLPPKTELCNGLDDDCNGKLDDMGTTSCGLGVCKNTVLVCENQKLNTCVANDQNKLPETCNGKDDDCDGTVDNGFNLTSDVDNCGSCNNACRVKNGTAKCETSTCAIATCNVSQGYDDCDQKYATGCETDIWSDLNHCGACGKPCAFANAAARCNGGLCSMGACTPGWYDLNGVAADGCEYNCTVGTPGAPDSPDDSIIDANCDGIDGDKAKAVFVDCSFGSDANDGTFGKPVKTLARAFLSASATARNQVLVSGTCVESVNLEDGVGLYGGYDQSFKRSLSKPSTIASTSPGVPAITGIAITLPTAVDAFVLTAPNAINAGGSSIAVRLVNSSPVTISNCSITAGDGLKGADQSDRTQASGGSKGNAGFPGGNGTSVGGGGGQGGSSACSSGGSGGTGGYNNNNGSTGGGGGCGVGGGGGAWGRCTTGDGCAGKEGGDWGGAGCTGGGGGPGSNGGSGSGAGSISSGGLFTPGNGGNGTRGGNGQGGGGGGGGGGATSDLCAKACIFGCCACVGTCNADRGGGGGGGGGGGCGGDGGLGGGGGGASIGILLSGSSISIRDTTITAGNGGDGGRGGSGGAGGLGASGEIGGGAADDAGGGGRGGSGGDGGKGGSGAGGGGGPSVAIYHANGSTPSVANVFYNLGNPGLGGSGGSGAPVGAGGISQNIYP